MLAGGIASSPLSVTCWNPLARSLDESEAQDAELQRALMASLGGGK